MKIYKLITLCYMTAIAANSNAQNDTIAHSLPFYWTYEVGANYLTSSTSVKNHNSFMLPTASGSFYFNWNFPVGKNHSNNMSGFYISPGAGFGVGTYSIDKELTENDGLLIINNINGAYRYSYIQGIYLDIPIDLRYFFNSDSKFRNFYLECGGKFGRLLLTKKEIASSQGDNFYVHTTKNAGIMNPYRYGLNAKAGIRKIKISRHNDTFGISFSTIINYYFSNAFKFDEINPSKSMSIGVGLGLIFK